MNYASEFEWLPLRSGTGTGTAPTTMPAPIGTAAPFVVLDGFAFDDATMPARHLPIIERIARLVVASRGSAQPIETVRLVGHADPTGTVSYNQALARRRAEAVGTALNGAILALGPVPAGRLVVVTDTRGESAPVASNRTAAGRARNRRVSVFLPNTCQTFFAQYDLRFLPGDPVFGIPAHPNLDAATKAQRSADVGAVVTELSRRLRLRASEALEGRSPAFGPLPAGSLRSSAVRLSDAQLELFREYFPAGGGGIDFAAMQTCFERFANGELRSPIKEDQARGIGEPNGAFFFLFAEFAFLCIDSGIQVASWTAALRAFVATQEIFMHVYRPAPKAPPPVGAKLPKCKRARGGKRTPRHPLSAYLNKNFRKTGASPRVGLGQSDAARKRALRGKYARAGAATLRVRARENLQRAQCTP